MNLEVERIFGYQGQVRPVLACGKGGEFLYPAALGIMSASTDPHVEPKLWIPGDGGHPVGNLSLHPNRTALAVTERCHKVALIIYSYPQKRQLQRISDVARVDVADMRYSRDGLRFVVLADAPACNVSLFQVDAATNKMVLLLQSKPHAHLYEQISFSPRDVDCLCASGGGHLVFWHHDTNSKSLVPTDGKVSTAHVRLTSHVWLPSGLSAAGTSSGEVFAFPPEDGVGRSVFQLPSASTEGSSVAITALAIARHHVAIGCSDGAVLFVDPNFESTHFTVRSSLDSILRLQFTPEWHSLLLSGPSSIGLIHLPGYEDVHNTDFRRQTSRVATLHQGPLGEAIGVVHHLGSLATVVSKNGVALTLDYSKNTITNQVHVGEQPLTAKRMGGTWMIVTSQLGTVRVVDVSKPAESAVILRARVSDSPLSICEVNRSGTRAMMSDGRTIAFFSKDDTELHYEGIVKINTVTPAVALVWVDGLGGFLLAQQGGEVGLYGPPFFDENCESDPHHGREIHSEQIFINSWRLDFPVQTMFVSAVYDEGINLLTHSLDKESKLYILDRTLSVDRKDREAKAVKPQLTMKDHEKRGTGWYRLREKYTVSAAADGKVVVRDTTAYLNRLTPAPPAKEKRDPVSSIGRHSWFGNGVVGLGVSDDETRMVTAGSDGTMIVYAIGRQAPLAVSALKISTPRVTNKEEEDTVFFAEKRRLQQEEFDRLRHQEHRLAIRKAIDRLRERLQQVRQENEAAAEDEKVPLQDFLIEQQKTQFEEECALAIQEMAENEHFANLNRDYVADIIRKECWEVMETKLTRLRAMSTSSYVFNFHERKVTQHDLVILRKLKFMRLVEMREAEVRGVSDLSELRESTNEEAAAAQQAQQNQEVEPLAVAKKSLELEAMEDPAPFLYQNLVVFTRHRAIIQLTLLRGKTFSIRFGFNKVFAELVSRKKQDLIKIEERNVRCRQVLKELDEQRPIFAPAFAKDEDPKFIFDVADDEVPADKSLDPEEKRRLAAEAEEKQRWIERHGNDDSADKALKAWMDGRLEKEVRTLDVKIDLPEFADEHSEKFVPLEDRSEDQQRIFKDYEKALAKRIEEVATRRAALQAEFTQLQKENVEQAKKFDIQVADLFQKRLVSQQQCFEVELSQVKLGQCILLQRERTRLAKKMEQHRQSIHEQHERATRATLASRHKAQAAHHKLEQLKEDEKNKEKNLRSSYPFSDSDWGDALVRIFTKKKPKKPDHKKEAKLGDTKRGAEETEGPTSMDPFSFLEEEQQTKLRRYTEDPQFQLPRLDQGEIPAQIWDSFQKYRQERVNAERDIVILTDDLAECERDVEDAEAREAELAERERDAFEQFDKFQKDALREQFDVDELYRFRQGQVEVEQAPVVTDYADAILINSSQIHRLNKLIRGSGTEKISLMREINEKKKEIRLTEWEMEKLSFDTTTLEMELRHLHTLRVTKQMQEYINGGGEDHNEKERVKLIRHIEHVQKSMAQKIEDRRQQIWKLRRAVKDKELENMLLLDQVAECKGLVDERKSIRDLQSAELDVERTNKLMKDMRVTRKLEDVAKAQQEEMLLLKKEIDRLRERTFPSFAVVSKRVVGNPDQL